MPIYEYACTACGDVTEVLHKPGEGRRRKCRKCSGRLEKLVSRTSFQLKGGGWFSEGYGPAPAKKKSTSDENKKKTGSSAGTDKKSKGGDASSSSSSRTGKTGSG